LKEDKVQNAARYREKLIEITVETDDTLLNRYLEGEQIPQETVERQFKIAIMQGKVTPILVAVAPKEIGIKEFLEVVTECAPSPLDVPAKGGKIPGKDEKISFPPKEESLFSAKIFKIFNDPFGRVVYLKVYSGTLASASTIYDVNTGKTERISNLLHLAGKEQKGIEKAIPGDIVAIAKVDNVQTGHTLAAEKSPILYDHPPYPVPMVSLAVQPKSRGDEQKIFISLTKLMEEDPTFQLKRDEETHELVISGMSNLHLEIMLARLKNRFKVECFHALPRIPYRETITGKSESRYRHKKQTGGHGQFGEVAIKLEPTERGVGFDFVNAIVGGVIPSQFVLSTEKGIQGTLTRGILAGYPIVDVRVTLHDGKTHDVDSSDAAFQLAGSKAFQEAFMSARPVLVEPIVNIEITIPAKFMGDIMGDLNSRRGRIMGSDADGTYQVIKAQVPLAEIITYSTELKSITGGEGSYSISISHYDIVPAHLQDKIIARAKEDKEKREKEK
jgi:elongation factor G